MNDGEARELTAKALMARPELAGLGEQARSLASQVQATKANIRPQVSLNGGFLFLGSEKLRPPGLRDRLVPGRLDVHRLGQDPPPGRVAQGPGAGRRRSGRPTSRADVALQVRTRWLDVQTSRQRVPIARFAVIQAEENVKVITDRYRQQLSTYTEVLDAENRRISSLNDFYNAVYDENLSVFRLRRAVGDI